MKFLKKIQSLPKEKRKKIFWIIMSVIFIVFLSFYIRDVQITLKEKKESNIEESLELNEIQGTINQIKNQILKE